MKNTIDGQLLEERTLLQRYILFGKTTLKLFVVGGCIGSVACWCLARSINDKLDRLYSKSSPHRLERLHHLYVEHNDTEPIADLENDDDDVTEDVPSEIQRFARQVSEKANSVLGVLKNSQWRQELNDKLNAIYKSNRDDPSLLIKLANSNNSVVSNYAIEALVKLPHKNWRNDDYWRVAQSLDTNAIIGISQFPNVDLRFFLPLKKSDSDSKKVDAFTRLQKLLAELPLEGTDEAAKYFTDKALKMAKDMIEPSDDLLYNEGTFLGGDQIGYGEAVQHISITPREKQEICCLQALLCHSRMENNLIHFRKLPILPCLFDLLSGRNSMPIKVMVSEIIGNIACHPSIVLSLTSSGLVGVLVQWRDAHNSSFPLRLAATRALINVHGTYVNRRIDNQKFGPCLLEGIYSYHPTRSFLTADFDTDMIFVHGLLGGVAYTWRQSVNCDYANKEVKGLKPKGTCEEFSYCWPQDWLPEDFDRSRIFGVDYSTQLSDWDPEHPWEAKEKKTLAARALDMLSKLKAAGVGKNPIVWVTHSMGGLLVKEILRLSEQQEDDILENSCGVIFYGTPHKGSPSADLSSNFSFILLPTVEVQELSKSNRSYLDELNKYFGKLVEKGLPSLSFGELKPTCLGDYVRNASVHLVPPDSANPGFGQFIPIDTDHLNICKPGSDTDYLYTLTVNFIKDCIEKKKIQKALKLAEEAIAADSAEIIEANPDDMNHYWDHY